MTASKTRRFDLDQVMEILTRGVRRADVFMGIGLNAASHDPPISHVLANLNYYQIHLAKAKLNDEERAHVIGEFDKWIRANGLRELIETFSIFLCGLHAPLFALNKGRDTEGNPITTPRRFEKLGVSNQLDALAKLILINEADQRMMASLNQARNCYAHRQGRVGETDLDAATETLSITWRALDIEAAEPDGNIVIGEALMGRRFDEGAKIQVQVVDRQRVFVRKDELLLEQHDLKEICLAVLSLGQRLLQATIESAESRGALTKHSNT